MSGFQELTLSASLLVEGEEAPDWCAIKFLQVQPTLDWLDLCPFLCTSLECEFSTTDVHLQLSARNPGLPVRWFIPTRLQSRFLSFQQQLLDSGDDEGTLGVFADWASDHDLPDLEASLRERLRVLNDPRCSVSPRVVLA